MEYFFCALPSLCKQIYGKRYDRSEKKTDSIGESIPGRDPVGLSVGPEGMWDQEAGEVLENSKGARDEPTEHQRQKNILFNNFFSFLRLKTFQVRTEYKK